MNVYVRELTRQLGKMGIHVDVFTRSQDDHVPHVLHELGYGNRVVHVPAGRKSLQKKNWRLHPKICRGRSTSPEKGLKYDVIHSHY
jgi:D-inositol-3-phosphate glycosyltransferase